MDFIARNLYTDNWITIVLVLCLLIFALAKVVDGKKFYDFMILPFNNKYLLLYNKTGKSSSGFSILLSLFQLLSVSLFFWINLDFFNLKFVNTSGTGYLAMLIGLSSFFLIKIFIQKIIGYLFNIEELIDTYIFKKVSYLNYSSILLLIAVSLMLYAFNDSSLVVYLAVISFLLINIIGWVFTVRIHQKVISHKIFYFILYLCALEIAPYVFIGLYF